MMGMEPETKDFLIRIVNTISIVLVWMLVNVFIGIYKGFAFFEDYPGWANYLFYIFLMISLVLMILYLKKKWKV